MQGAQGDPEKVTGPRRGRGVEGHLPRPRAQGRTPHGAIRDHRQHQGNGFGGFGTEARWQLRQQNGHMSDHLNDLSNLSMKRRVWGNLGKVLSLGGEVNVFLGSETL